MTSIAETPLARLDTEQRLINSHVKEAGSAPGSFLFRGELAIHLAPTELKANQVMIAAVAGQKELSFYTCHLDSFASLKPMAELLGDMLGASGKYFVFCNDIKFSSKYRVKMGEATFYVLPLDEKTAFVELLELLNLERGPIKKLDLRGKVEAVANVVGKFNPSYAQLSYEEGLGVLLSAKDSGGKPRA